MYVCLKNKNKNNKDNPGEPPLFKPQALYSALRPLSKLGGGRYAVMGALCGYGSSAIGTTQYGLGSLR